MRAFWSGVKSILDPEFIGLIVGALFLIVSVTLAVAFIYASTAD